jgi:hypothetical protein
MKTLYNFMNSLGINVYESRGNKLKLGNAESPVYGWASVEDVTYAAERIALFPAELTKGEQFELWLEMMNIPPSVAKSN